jgi:hypothetical protein
MLMGREETVQMLCRRGVILRGPARYTLRLAEAVRAEGITAWAPTEVARPKVPKRRARLTLCEPILPRFVFADAARLLDLLAMSHRPLAVFSVISEAGRYPAIPDSALEPLRVEEGRREWNRIRNVKGRPLPRGTRVAMPKGAWEGLSGTVERSSGKVTRIDLGRFSVDVDTWLLTNDAVDSRDMAA